MLRGGQKGTEFAGAFGVDEGYLLGPADVITHLLELRGAWFYDVGVL